MPKDRIREEVVREPIAIVGLGCRFPGGARNPEAFWKLLLDEVDAVTEVPASRFALDAVYDPRPQTPGRISTRYGAFLEDIEAFDADFFGISAPEAKNMDPQQRLLLEVAWEALEDAGLPLERIPRRHTGVYVGMMASEYEDKLHSDVGSLNGFALNGSGRYGASGRLSYCLGLHGPSLTIDTACSSSLVSVHLACESLRRHECDLALAGGAHAILQPHVSISLCQANILAVDGHCKFGDARADGFVRGEGAGIVVLKRLADAFADEDRIYAVIRSSAVNNDGNATRTMGRPSRELQEEMLREAYRLAGVDPAEVDYVEAHGTGTVAGDSAELGALATVLGAARTAARPLRVGSVKTNIGHTEGASGVAGLIKLALSLERGQLARSLHCERPSAALASEPRLSILSKAEPWVRGAEPRRGGVNSFGMSGTNAHAVLEDVPVQAGARRERSVERPAHVLPLSAKNADALRELAKRYVAHLDAHPELALEDICHTAAVGRSHMSKRVALVARSREALRAQLVDVAAGSARARDARRGNRVAFLFTGQGSQYAGMGRTLYATQPVFRAALDRCAELLAPRLRVPLLDVMNPLPGEAAFASIDETEYTQPALFAIEYALAELWRSWGVTPAAVLGHSVGEYAAACVAGVMSLEDALRLIAERGKRMQALPCGAMAAVEASEARVEAVLTRAGGRVSIAAVNAPEQIVLSGEPEALDEVLGALEREGVKIKRLDVSHAFHSQMMDPMLDGFERAVGEATLSAPKLDVVSNVTGTFSGADFAAPAYWRRHVREPVRFAEGLDSLWARGYDTLIEVGPHPTLLGLAASSAPDASRTLLPSLQRKRDDWDVLLDSVARLYERGVDIDWAAFDRPYARRRVALPTYPWQKRRHWVEAARSLESTRPEAIAEEGSPSSERAPSSETGASQAARVIVQEMRDILQLSADTPRDISLVELGVSSLGISVLKSHLMRFAGGKELARQIGPTTVLSTLLPFLESARLGETGTFTIRDYLRRAEWTDVTPASVNKQSSAHVLLSRCSWVNLEDRETVIAELRMNTSHPFFYERPLDHVPGLYLIEAFRQMFNWRLYSKLGRLDSGGTLDRVEADFFQFVEHDVPAYIVLTPDEKTFSADLFQSEARKACFSMAARRIAAGDYERIRSEQRRVAT